MCVLQPLALLLRPQTLELGAVDLNTVTDGEYIGVCQNKILIAVVMEQAETIARKVCAEQTLEVDAVSGATLTSETVLKAIENALK